MISLPRDYDIAPQVGCLLPCGALRVYAALRHSRSCFDTAVRIRGFANLLVVAGDSVDGLELWTVLLVKNVLCDRNVKVSLCSVIVFIAVSFVRRTSRKYICRFFSTRPRVFAQ